MRKKLGQLLVVGLLATLRAQGQDAASTPFRESPPPAEPPAPSPTARPTPVATIEQQAAAAESSPSGTPIPVQRAQPVRRGPALEPVRALTPRPANAKPAPKAEAAKPQAAKPAEPQHEELNGSAGDRIKTLEREWESAIANHDASVIERVVADDFVGVSSTGRIGDKGTLLAEAKRDKNTYKTASARQMTVRMYGSHVAVVLGMTKESGTTASGRPFDHTYRFTDTWMERDGKWQCIAAHAAVAGKR